MDSRSGAVLIFLALSPTALTAQGAVALSTVQPGARVRLTTGCVAGPVQPGRAPSPNRRDVPERCSRYTARYLRAVQDSVVLELDGEPHVIPTSEIRSMLVRTGRRGNWGLGAGIGAMAGLVAGLVSAATTDCSDDFLQDLCEGGRILAPVFLGGVGAGVGALVGGLIRSDRWEPVSFRMAGWARPARPAVAVVIRF